MALSSQYTIRPAKASEASTIARLLQRAIPQRIRPLTILGQEGIVNWIECAIRQTSPHPNADPSGQPTTEFLVAATDDTLHGTAEWRTYDQTLFLNGISVHPNHQQRGLGRTLLRRGLSRHETLSSVTLDVFADNQVAQRWYKRLGFRSKGTREWIVCHLQSLSKQKKERASDANTDSSNIQICNKSRADEQHAQFGFSTLQFKVHNSQDSNHKVGRLGDAYFRITEASTFANPLLRDTLLKLDSSRQLLYLKSTSSTASPPPPPKHTECKARSLRMEAPFPLVSASLS